MKVLFQIFQTLCLSIAFVFLLWIVSVLRSVWLKFAIKIRQKYNKKHGLPDEYGIGEIDKDSLSYQIDSVEGTVAAVCLFVLCGLLVLFVPISDADLFSIIALVISIAEFIYCLFVRSKWTKRFRILVYASGIVSLLLFTYALVSLLCRCALWVTYSNSIRTILYIWTAMILYRLILDRKQK